jgi:ParB family chromosome partitioning protein
MHYMGNDESNQQSAEEILLSVPDRLEDDQLPRFALRLAHTTHTGIPDENAIDHLAEAEKVFAPAQSKKATARKTASKKAARKPMPDKSKAAKKKTTKRICRLTRRRGQQWPLAPPRRRP